ncbi:hypothetical protein AV654_10420 [Paenibacillus elgii]|uniref:Uncharacterized protein n=1 Tax=Paenibacillus elgii TaxID=189691 RepID=A0A161S6U6_9BACL|nr:DUF6445 family protein [Paenibacillus elgii]KZE80764.1 hypothetical protein AV654_10420 [Paenibacillus elgii]MCM3268660.1 DUF6445 family protein [Paenibacillus elgii]
MDTKVIVVDNFYLKPDLVRNLAIKDDYRSGAKNNYPGYESHRFFGIDTLAEVFQKLIGKQIYYNPDRFTFGGFRIITEKTGFMPKVHADSVDWAGLIFLTPEAALDKGVGFYRHLETGFESPPTDKDARKKGYEDSNEFERQVIYRDQADLSKWELMSFISPVYNRLVLFKGRDLYHAPLGGFGENPGNARLTQNFFFLEKN